MIVVSIIFFTGIVDWVLTGDMDSGILAVISLLAGFVITAILMKGLAHGNISDTKRKSHVERPPYFD